MCVVVVCVNGKKEGKKENDNAETRKALSDAEEIGDSLAQGVSIEVALADAGAGRAHVDYGRVECDAG